MIERLIVAIPARDEQDTIAECIASVDRAAAMASLPTWVVVASDSCADDTAEVARRVSVSHSVVAVIEGSWGRVGAARRAAVGGALDAAAGPRPTTWIANTDGDTEVPASWLRDQLDCAGSHHAIAGIVDLDPRRVPTAMLDRFRSAYHLQGDAHTHVHGANLGVRADWYAAVGGWCPETMVGEDWGLWNRLIAAGATTRHTVSVRVVTSGRLVSRVEGGFATDLCALTASSPRAPLIGAGVCSDRERPGESVA